MRAGHDGKHTTAKAAHAKLKKRAGLFTKRLANPSRVGVWLRVKIRRP